jgi:hypothetical protein
MPLNAHFDKYRGALVSRRSVPKRLAAGQGDHDQENIHLIKIHRSQAKVAILKRDAESVHEERGK